MGQCPNPPTLMTTAAGAALRATRVRSAGPSRRRRSMLAVSLLVVSLLAGCGTGNRVSVGAATTTIGPTTTRPTAAPATAVPPSVAPTTAVAPTTTPPTSATTIPSPTSTVSPGSGTTPCVADQLAVDQSPLSEGTGQYYLAWSLTNSGAAACSLAPGHPTLGLVDAAGQPVVSYPTKDLPGGSATTLVIAPHAAVWFLTEELSTSCPAPVTVDGGPFDYVVTLPQGLRLTWSPSYLAGATLSDLCTDVPLSIGSLQSAKPRP
jgi:hypothetical protein